VSGRASVGDGAPASAPSPSRSRRAICDGHA